MVAASGDGISAVESKGFGAAAGGQDPWVGLFLGLRLLARCEWFHERLVVCDQCIYRVDAPEIRVMHWDKEIGMFSARTDAYTVSSISSRNFS